MSKNFQKNIEDFVCENCGADTKGNGFTNHCPKCLWSKHVDVNPGDRAAGCGGKMKPTEVEKDGDSYTLTHTCEVCGHTKKNKLAQDDSMESVIDVAKTLASK